MSMEEIQETLAAFVAAQKAAMEEANSPSEQIVVSLALLTKRIELLDNTIMPALDDDTQETAQLILASILQSLMETIELV